MGRSSNINNHCVRVETNPVKRLCANKDALIIASLAIIIIAAIAALATIIVVGAPLISIIAICSLMGLVIALGSVAIITAICNKKLPNMQKNLETEDQYNADQNSTVDDPAVHPLTKGRSFSESALHRQDHSEDGMKNASSLSAIHITDDVVDGASDDVVDGASDDVVDVASDDVVDVASDVVDTHGVALSHVQVVEPRRDEVTSQDLAGIPNSSLIIFATDKWVYSKARVDALKSHLLKAMASKASVLKLFKSDDTLGMIKAAFAGKKTMKEAFEAINAFLNGFHPFDIAAAMLDPDFLPWISRLIKTDNAKCSNQADKLLLYSILQEVNTLMYIWLMSTPISVGDINSLMEHANATKEDILELLTSGHLIKFLKTTGALTSEVFEQTVLDADGALPSSLFDLIVCSGFKRSIVRLCLVYSDTRNVLSYPSLLEEARAMFKTIRDKLKFLDGCRNVLFTTKCLTNYKQLSWLSIYLKQCLTDKKLLELILFGILTLKNDKAFLVNGFGLINTYLSGVVENKLYVKFIDIILAEILREKNDDSYIELIARELNISVDECNSRISSNSLIASLL